MIATLSRLSIVSATVRLLTGPTEGAVEDRCLIQLVLAVRAELRPDIVDVGEEAALGFSKQVQKRMAVEVDPDQ